MNIPIGPVGSSLSKNSEYYKPSLRSKKQRASLNTQSPAYLTEEALKVGRNVDDSPFSVVRKVAEEAKKITQRERFKAEPKNNGNIIKEAIDTYTNKYRY